MATRTESLLCVCSFFSEPGILPGITICGEVYKYMVINIYQCLIVNSTMMTNSLLIISK